MESKAPELLQKAATHLLERAAQYDKPEGERSMGQAIAAFNIITGRELREDEGWLLMQILKDVRLYHNTRVPHRDSIEDGIAYSALKGEAWLQPKTAQPVPFPDPEIVKAMKDVGEK